MSRPVACLAEWTPSFDIVRKAVYAPILQSVPSLSFTYRRGFLRTSRALIAPAVKGRSFIQTSDDLMLGRYLHQVAQQWELWLRKHALPVPKWLSRMGRFCTPVGLRFGSLPVISCGNTMLCPFCRARCLLRLMGDVVESVAGQVRGKHVYRHRVTWKPYLLEKPQDLRKAIQLNRADVRHVLGRRDVLGGLCGRTIVPEKVGDGAALTLRVRVVFFTKSDKRIGGEKLKMDRVKIAKETVWAGEYDPQVLSIDHATFLMLRYLLRDRRVKCLGTLHLKSTRPKSRKKAPIVQPNTN